jgi:ankyrin repeat protein
MLIGSVRDRQLLQLLSIAIPWNLTFSAVIVTTNTMSDDGNQQNFDPTHKQGKYDTSLQSECMISDSEALAIADAQGCLPLHQLLSISSSLEAALMMIEKYPAALQHRNHYVELPLHIECKHRCRSIIISKRIKLYPEALAVADRIGFLPLHWLLMNRPGPSSIEDALMLIMKYPAALSHQNIQGQLPLHTECSHSCRSTIIAKCIELYPDALAAADIERNQIIYGNTPLHLLLSNFRSSIEDTLIMIEKCPAALQHRNNFALLISNAIIDVDQLSY